MKTADESADYNKIYCIFLVKCRKTQPIDLTSGATDRRKPFLFINQVGFTDNLIPAFYLFLLLLGFLTFRLLGSGLPTASELCEPDEALLKAGYLPCFTGRSLG
ncbi:MAG: hypothetical protein NT056_02495 [Proteobacteria bacterium]|nr:hypothetical protein [Pseudomonadota bacterium]